MPTSFDDMEPAEVEPYWCNFTDDGYTLEHDDEQVAERDGAIIGMLMDIDENVGPNNSRLYTLRTEEDPRPIKIWGGTHIDNQVDDIPHQPPYELGIRSTGETRETERGPMDLYDVRYFVD